jgi:hypothetical protein
MSPESRGLGLDNGFLGDVDPSNADQIQLWRGDSENGASGYEGYFLLDAGEGTRDTRIAWRTPFGRPSSPRGLHQQTGAV